VQDQSTDTKRRRRLAAPGIGFIGGLLLLAAIVAAVIVVIYWVGGFGEGSEGAFALVG
jgi:hypothetical protein